MITTLIKSNVLNVRRGIIVHGCNALGIMGAGVAEQVRKRWPGSYQHYVDHCEALGSRALGTITYTTLMHEPDGDKPELMVVHAITQARVGAGKQVSYDAMDECFSRVAPLARKWNLPLHFPLVGCGLAGGRWTIVAAIIEENTRGIEKFLHVV